MATLIERLRGTFHHKPMTLRNPDGPEAADRIEQLERRYECHYSEATDADLGRAFRAFARKVEAFSGKEWEDEGERRLGLMNMGLMAVVKMAAESNAETFSATYEGFTICGEPMGDWTVTVSRKKPEPCP